MTTNTLANSNTAWTKGAFYRQCRLWHGYLSAFTFIALLFFSASGIMMNHPATFKALPPQPTETSLALTATQLAQIKGAPSPESALVKLVGDQLDLKGAFYKGQVGGDDGDHVLVRMTGARGWSEIRGDLRTGEVDVTVEPRTMIGVVNELHKANGGKFWHLLVDVLGSLMIAVALIGYILFLSLRFRLRTSLALTGLSLVIMTGLFVATVR